VGFAGQARVGDGARFAARIELTEDAIQVLPEAGPPVHLSLVDIDDLHDDDYVLRLTDHTGARYELTMLGRAYGQLLADLRSRRDEALERALLLRGVGLQDTFPGKLFGGPGPMPVQLRLYEDLLVVVPERGRMFGVPYSFIDRVDWDEELYQVRLVTDEGTTFTFGQLARRSEEFRDELRRLLDALAARTAATLGELMPGLPPATLSRVAELMRDGRAVQRRRLDEVDPSVWPRLEEAAAGSEARREAYDRLAARTVPGWAAFGVKAVRPEEDEEADLPEDEEAATADREGERSEGEPERPADLWYFCPLALDARPANALAQEVVSTSGRATYVFRLMDPERFGSLDADALAEEVARCIARLNRALLLLNFRRDPIRLPEERLARGPDARYRVALRHLDYLRWARASFLGRAVHGPKWAAQLAEAVGRAV